MAIRAVATEISSRLTANRSTGVRAASSGSFCARAVGDRRGRVGQCLPYEGGSDHPLPPAVHARPLLTTAPERRAEVDDDAVTRAIEVITSNSLW